MSIPGRSYPAWQRAETIRSKAYRCVPSVHCAMALWSEDGTMPSGLQTLSAS
jgi:hypothetical protein